MSESKGTPARLPISALGEFDLIRRLVRGETQATSRAVHAQLIGPGDDCAALLLSHFAPTGGWLVWSTDVMVEQVHFTREYFAGFDLGWKLLAVNLSDIAAVGGKPLAALITLQLPASTELHFVEELYRGLNALAEKWNVSILGGDTVEARELSVGASIVGICERPPIRRSAAKPGEDLWLSGEIGASNLGLTLLKRELQSEGLKTYAEDVCARHLRPIPRLELGLALSHALATAMIDVSDGLLQDATHLARESNVTLELALDTVPYHPGVDGGALGRGQAITGGEDYELLFTSPVGNRERITQLSGDFGALEVPLTRIGSVIERDPAGALVIVVDHDKKFEANAWVKNIAHLPVVGYEHFKP